jgi:predicted RNA binding protein YcfA (HicA-like mRNA interferase family)
VDRKEQVKRLLKSGFVFLRSGAKQDLYLQPKSGKRVAVPREKRADKPGAKIPPKTTA